MMVVNSWNIAFVGVVVENNVDCFGWNRNCRMALVADGAVVVEIG